MEEENKEELYTIQKILKIYGTDVSRSALIKAENSGLIPQATRKGKNPATARRLWRKKDFPKIGERYGFLTLGPTKPIVVTSYSTKGGSLKSTVVLNFARTAALHNKKVCVVGLDMQCDISMMLGFDLEGLAEMSLKKALEEFNSYYSLYDLVAPSNERPSILDIIESTDLPTLDYIPESPSLATLNEHLGSVPDPARWVQTNIVDPLKAKYDIIVFDCSPNWNRLVSSALFTTDVLISPLECKINHFRNHPIMMKLIEDFTKSSKVKFKHILVPTKKSNKKLHHEIHNFYQLNLKNITQHGIRESIATEEATAMHLSQIEAKPSTLQSEEMRELIKEIWGMMTSNKNKQKPSRQGGRKVKNRSRLEDSL